MTQAASGDAVSSAVLPSAGLPTAVNVSLPSGWPVDVRLAPGAKLVSSRELKAQDAVAVVLSTGEEQSVVVEFYEKSLATMTTINSVGDATNHIIGLKDDTKTVTVSTFVRTGPTYGNKEGQSTTEVHLVVRDRTAVSKK